VNYPSALQGGVLGFATGGSKEQTIRRKLHSNADYWDIRQASKVTGGIGEIPICDTVCLGPCPG